MMKRLFIAIKITKDETLEGAFQKLRVAGKNVKWTEPGSLHLTLVFLGDTDEMLIPSLKECLSSICSHTPGFIMENFALGTFGTRLQPNVIWMGIKNNPGLDKLYNELFQQLQKLGFELEKRPFKPHVTLGRIKKADNFSGLLKIIQEHSASAFGSTKVNEIILFESTLTPQGPVYKEIHCAKLQ